MAKVFVSYRRDDSQHQADRLCERLRPYLKGEGDELFIDVDNIPFGVDFVTHLESRISQCDVLLALIGPDWLDVRNKETGARRLDEPGDFVRIEIATALKRAIRVVPVYLDGASAPSAKDLPEDLKGLARQHGISMRRETFSTDADRLISGLNFGGSSSSVPSFVKSTKKRGASLWLGVLAVLVLVGVLGFWGLQSSDPEKSRAWSTSEIMAKAEPILQSLRENMAPEADRNLREKARSDLATLIQKSQNADFNQRLVEDLSRAKSSEAYTLQLAMAVALKEQIGVVPFADRDAAITMLESMKKTAREPVLQDNLKNAIERVSVR